VGAAVSLSISAFKDSPYFAFLFPLAAFPVGLLLWMIEVRIRELYGAAQKAGASLENSTRGVYTNIGEVSEHNGRSPLMIFVNPPYRITHALALNLLFILGSVCLLGLSVWLYCKANFGETRDPKVALQRALDFMPSFHKQPSPIWVFESMTFDAEKNSYEIVVTEQTGNTRFLVTTDGRDRVAKAQRLP